ncbi:MAG: HPP family protein [Desulfopila sp.]
MDHYSVKDLMVPISEYATVPLGTSLLDAINVLERVQAAYTSSKYQHRAILVLDDDGDVVGKIGQLRVLKAVETRPDLTSELEELEKFNFSSEYMVSRQEQYRLGGPILRKEALQAAAAKKVEEFMQKPTPGEYVAEDSTLDHAIHKLIAGTHFSLLVTRNGKIVGILRIADVFAAVYHEMKSQRIGPPTG